MKTKLTLFLLTISLLIGTGLAQQTNPLAEAHALFKAGKYVEAKAAYQKNIRVPGARAYIFQCNLSLIHI